jgi:hypothetical protein
MSTLLTMALAGLAAIWALEALIVLLSLRTSVKAGSAEPIEPAS